MNTKVCNKCGIEKTTNNFTFRKETGKYRCTCHECRRKEYRTNKKIRNIAIKRAKEYYKNNTQKVLKQKKNRYVNNLEKVLYDSARRRAKERNVPFDIEISDIIIPKKCPIFGFAFEIGTKNKQKSASVDRIIPNKGYVKGNIIVVSLKANTMKSNATIDEIKKLYEFYKKIIKNKEGGK